MKTNYSQTNNTESAAARREVSPDSGVGKRLLDRGINLKNAVEHGAERIAGPEEMRHRLGWPSANSSSSGDKGLGSDTAKRRARTRSRHCFDAEELLCFPLHDNKDAWFNILVSTVNGSAVKRVTLGAKQPLFIPAETWAVKGDSREPVFFTEGPEKALALLQADCKSVGVIGTWMSEKVPGTGRAWRRQVCLMKALRQFEWRNREVFFVFDADEWRKSGVRRSVIRNFFLLSPLGARVHVLRWDEKEGKGIDDYLVGKEKPAEALAELVKEARGKDFVSGVERADLRLVAKELRAVQMGKPDHTHFCKEFASRFKVNRTDFGKYPEKQHETEGSEDEAPEWARDPLPWTGDPPILETILDSIEKEFLSFFDISPEQAAACVLWIATTYFMDVWQIHPYLGITAAVKNSGKTSLLIFVSLFSYRPWVGASITASTVYRVVDECRPSLFVDEIADTFKDKSDVKTVFKAAYTRASARIPRTEKIKEQWVVRHYYAFCAKAFDLTGKISAYDDSIEDRSIEIHMLMEKIEHRNFWEEVMGKNPTMFVPYQQQLFAWRREHLEELKAHNAVLPKFTNSRIRENWRALFTIAGLAGPKWHEKACACAEVLQKGQSPILTEPEYLAKALKALVRKHPELIETTAKGKRFLPTQSILEGRRSSGLYLSDKIGLKADKEAPWADRQPDGLTQMRLGQLLSNFRVKSVQVRIPQLKDPVRGYWMEELEEKVFTIITPK
jgi:hypothetical protein